MRHARSLPLFIFLFLKPAPVFLVNTSSSLLPRCLAQHSINSETQCVFRTKVKLVLVAIRSLTGQTTFIRHTGALPTFPHLSPTWLFLRTRRLTANRGCAPTARSRTLFLDTISRSHWKDQTAYTPRPLAQVNDRRPHLSRACCYLAKSVGRLQEI